METMENNSKKKTTEVPDSGNWEYAKPHAMWKSELAQMQGFSHPSYFFRRYVHGNPQLMQQLQSVGYRKKIK